MLVIPCARCLFHRTFDRFEKYRGEPQNKRANLTGAASAARFAVLLHVVLAKVDAPTVHTGATLNSYALTTTSIICHHFGDDVHAPLTTYYLPPLFAYPSLSSLRDSNFFHVFQCFQFSVVFQCFNLSSTISNHVYRSSHLSQLSPPFSKCLAAVFQLSLDCLYLFLVASNCLIIVIGCLELPPELFLDLLVLGL